MLRELCEKCEGMRLLGLGLLSLSFALTSCVRSEVTYVGNAKYPPKPEGCAVQVFPSTAPNYKWADIATVKAECHQSRGRTACIDEIRNRACELGGDTLYDFKDGVDREAAVVIATVAVRTSAPTEAPGQAPVSPQVAADGCNPPCSPGYACSNGQCMAVCNPPCGSAMRCNQQRMCEPTGS